MIEGLPIVKYGLPWLAGSLVLTAIFGYLSRKKSSLTLSALCALFALCAFFFILFFRNPERHPQAEDLALIPGNPILAPADGKITDIIQTDDSLRIGIFLSPLDYHVQRAPLAGRVTSILRKEGERLPANWPEASTKNASCAITIFNDSEKIEIQLKLITGIVARRIIPMVTENELLRIGQRVGMIVLGSRVELTMPKKRVKLLIREGAKIKAGQSIIGVY